MATLPKFVSVDFQFTNQKSAFGVTNGLVFRPQPSSKTIRGVHTIRIAQSGKNGIFGEIVNQSNTVTQNIVTLPTKFIPQNLTVCFHYKDETSAFGISSGVVIRPQDLSKTVEGLQDVSDIVYKDGFFLGRVNSRK